MNRVYIAVALAITMLIGSNAYAGNKSFSMQFDANLISVNWSGAKHQGKQQFHKPQKWHKRKVVQQRQKPRMQKQFHKPALKGHGPRTNRWQKRQVRRFVKRAIRSHFGRQMNRHQQKRHGWK